MVGNVELRRHQERGDLGLFSRKELKAGVVVLSDEHILMAPTSTKDLFDFYLTLDEKKKSELKSMTSCLDGLKEEIEREIAMCVPHPKEVTDESDLQALAEAKKQEMLYDNFRNFMGIMRCNAHGISSKEGTWALFPIGMRCNHSCDPNVSYRYVEGKLALISLKPLEKDQELTMAYSDKLFGSTIYRRHRLLTAKHFICGCERCESPTDPTRKFLCPHCRNKKEDETEPVEPSKIPLITLNSDRQWECDGCKNIFEDKVLPFQVESTLMNLYSRLDTSFCQPDATSWLQYINYLSGTTATVLSPAHWLMAGCHLLLSRFFVGLAYGGDCGSQVLNNAFKHAEAFMDFVTNVTPEAVNVDVVPWASSLMRLSLSVGDYHSFVQLAVKYLPRLRCLYGAWDETVRAYEGAVKYLKLTLGEDPDPEMLKKFALDSQPKSLNNMLGTKIQTMKAADEVSKNNSQDEEVEDDTYFASDHDGENAQERFEIQEKHKQPENGSVEIFHQINELPQKSSLEKIQGRYGPPQNPSVELQNPNPLPTDEPPRKEKSLKLFSADGNGQRQGSNSGPRSAEAPTNIGEPKVPPLLQHNRLPAKRIPPRQYVQPPSPYRMEDRELHKGDWETGANRNFTSNNYSSPLRGFPPPTPVRELTSPSRPLLAQHQRVQGNMFRTPREYVKPIMNFQRSKTPAPQSSPRMVNPSFQNIPTSRPDCLTNPHVATGTKLQPGPTYTRPFSGLKLNDQPYTVATTTSRAPYSASMTKQYLPPKTHTQPSIETSATLKKSVPAQAQVSTPQIHHTPPTLLGSVGTSYRNSPTPSRTIKKTGYEGYIQPAIPASQGHPNLTHWRPYRSMAISSDSERLPFHAVVPSPFGPLGETHPPKTGFQRQAAQFTKNIQQNGFPPIKKFRPS